MKTLITNSAIQAKLSELAIQINEIATNNLQTVDAACVPVLQGATPFFVDLSKHFCWNPIVDYVGVSSYNEPDNNFYTYKMPKPYHIRGKIVFLFDDILDTGNTANYLINMLYSFGAVDVVPVFLLKRKSTSWMPDPRIKLVMHGFDINDEWVFGYGMDDVNGQFRTAKHILYNEQTTKTTV